MSTGQSFWTDLLGRIRTDVMDWLPALAAALGLLLLGWVLASLLRFVIAGLFIRLGVDRLAERAGAVRVLTGAGLDPSASRLLSRFVYWIILLVFVLAAAEALGLRAVAATMSGLIAYLPKVLAGIFILLLGGLIARVIGDAVGAMAARSEVRSGPIIGHAVRYVLLVFVVILAVEQLGVETPLLIAATIAVIGATALALALSFGWGSRELARNIMAGFHAKEEFAVGQQLNVRKHTGRLVKIGPIKSILETESGRVSLPNSALTEEEVEILVTEEDAR